MPWMASALIDFDPIASICLKTVAVFSQALPFTVLNSSRAFLALPPSFLSRATVTMAEEIDHNVRCSSVLRRAGIRTFDDPESRLEDDEHVQGWIWSFRSVLGSELLKQHIAEGHLREKEDLVPVLSDGISSMDWTDACPDLTEHSRPCSVTGNGSRHFGSLHCRSAE